MPWATNDVDRFKKGLTPNQKKQWVAVANSALANCLKKGGSSSYCDGVAIRSANGVVGAKREADETGIIYFGHTQDIVQHNVDILKQRGYEPDVARNIAHQIAGQPMPSEETTEEPEPASATNSTDQTA